MKPRSVLVHQMLHSPHSCLPSCPASNRHWHGRSCARQGIGSSITTYLHSYRRLLYQLCNLLEQSLDDDWDTFSWRVPSPIVVGKNRHKHSNDPRYTVDYPMGISWAHSSECVERFMSKRKQLLEELFDLIGYCVDLPHWEGRKHRSLNFCAQTQEVHNTPGVHSHVSC